MIPSGSCWFWLVLDASRQFLVVFGGSWQFLGILGGLLVVFGGP